MKYKVGDIVKIKENLKVDEFYGGEVFVHRMKEYSGKQARIICIYPRGYGLDIDGREWCWTDDMLEPNEEIKMKYKIGDIVKIKENLKAGNLYGKIMFASTMEEYCGKQTEIAYVGTYSYKLNVDKGEYIWGDDMLEPVSKKMDTDLKENGTLLKARMKFNGRNIAVKFAFDDIEDIPDNIGTTIKECFMLYQKEYRSYRMSKIFSDGGDKNENI